MERERGEVHRRSGQHSLQDRDEFKEKTGRGGGLVGIN